MASESRQVWQAFSAATVCLLAILAVPGVGRGETPVAPPTAPTDNAHLVLRVSGAMLNSLLADQHYDWQTDVRDTILGTAVFGRARTVGQPRVQLASSSDQAVFQVVFEGTVVARTVGYNGPAIIHSRTESRFRATRQIVFEPGKGFQALPIQATADTKIFVEGIGSRRRGLIGAIVRRRAARAELAQRSQATEIVREKTLRRVVSVFERNTEERLARLNGHPQLRSLPALALRGLGKSEPTFACCTSPECLQIAARFGDGVSPAGSLPSNIEGNPTSLIEIWLHDSMVGPRLAAPLDLLGSKIKVGEFLEAILPVGPENDISSQVRSRLPATIGQQPICVRKSGDWRVVAVAAPEATTQLASSVQPSSETHRSLKPITTSPVLATSNSAKANPAGRPPSARIWTSGKYTAEAEFVSLEGNLVRLRRVTGVNASIALEKLSAADQQWIRTHLAVR